jgi:hypothetical protein
MHIICSRFDNQSLVPEKIVHAGRMRISSINPKKVKRIFDRIVPLSKGDDDLFWDGVQWQSVDALLSALKPGERVLFMVVSHKECFPFSDFLSEKYRTWAVLDLSTWLSEEIKPDEDPAIRLMQLSDILHQVNERWGANPCFHRSVFHAFTTDSGFRVERSLRIKSGLDNFFFFTQMHGYSEVFRFLEDRDDRSVIVMDLRSMYAWCLTQPGYSKPSELEYLDGPHTLEEVKQISNGVWKVTLTPRQLNDDEAIWISRHHYLRYARQNTPEVFVFRNDDTIEAWLHASEIPFLTRWFEIEIGDGICSPYAINHPLKARAEKVFEVRSQEKNELYRNISKKHLLSMHGCMNSYKTEKIWLGRDEWPTFWDHHFQSDPFPDESRYCYPLVKKNESLLVKAYQIERHDTVYSLLSQTLAIARSHMLQWMSAIHAVSPDAEICYSNVDSVHVSIPSRQKEFFIEKMTSDGWIGERLGQAKIEAIGDSGVWMNVGKYMIFNLGDLVFHAGTPVKERPFQNKKIVDRMNLKTGEKKRIYISFMGGLSFNKRIIKRSKVIYDVIRNHADTLTEISNKRQLRMNEKIRSWRWRMGLYHDFLKRNKKRLASL